MLLQRRPNQKAAELAEQPGVSVRTVHRWGWWYAIGHCHLRGAIRSFRVDRILEVGLLCQTFEIPDDFEIHAYLAAEPDMQPQVREQALTVAGHHESTEV